MVLIDEKEAVSAVSNKQAILKDIDRLKISFLKLHPAQKENFTQDFHVLSLDSHHNGQLLLGCTNSVTFSGLTLGKEVRVKKVNFVGENCCFSGKLGFPSPKLGQRLSNIKGSQNSRWKCSLDLTDRDRSFTLIVTLEDNRQFVWGKIVFKQVRANIFDANEPWKKKINSIQKSRQIMVDNLTKKRNYMFVIGNARSGTTALVQLLNCSPEICLGVERYEQKDDVSAMSFCKEKFFDVNSNGYLYRPQFYEDMRDKFERAKYIGDKRPRFIKSWKNTYLNLPQAKIVYIFRDIYNVACSYNVRANNAAQGLDRHWEPNRDFSEAVKDWNEGIQEIQNLAQFYQVYLVKYEDFFVDPAKMIHLFNYLGVNTEDRDTKLGIEKTYKTALSVAKKVRNLADYEREYIDAHADFEAYNNLLALYEREFAR